MLPKTLAGKLPRCCKRSKNCKLGRKQGAALHRTSKALEKRVQEEELAVPMDADVLALVSSNLANIYFPPA